MVGVGETVREAGAALDRLFTSDDERQKNAVALAQVEQQSNAAQVEVNKQEAAHASLFIAGWRPALGWVCVAGCAYHFIVAPLLQFGLVVAGSEAELPVFDIGTLVSMVGGMLGLSWLRTEEKRAGVQGAH